MKAETIESIWNALAGAEVGCGALSLKPWATLEDHDKQFFVKLIRAGEKHGIERAKALARINEDWDGNVESEPVHSIDWSAFDAEIEKYVRFTFLDQSGSIRKSDAVKVENPKAADSEVRALRDRVKELEAAFARLASALESQQAAREEQELLEAVKAMLIKRNAEQRQYVELQLSLGVAFGEVSWKASDKFETFPTLSALLHAILKEEEKNATVHEST